MKGRSPLTIRDYEMYYKAFAVFTGDIEPEKITLALVDSFEKSLHEKRLEPSTVSYYLIFIRNFLKYLTRQGLQVLNYQLIELPRVQRKILPALNEQEIKKILSTCSATSQDGLRAKVIILFLLTSGCRVAELCSLKITDLEIEERRATIVGKGNKMRVIFFDDATAYFLKKYLENRPQQSDYVFSQQTNHGNQPITTRSIERLIKKHGELSGISKALTPHVLRRSYATRLLRKGVNIKALKELMGHTQIETTSRYITIEQDELRKIHQLAHKKSVKNVKEKEQLIISRESFDKLRGMIGKSVQTQNRILKRLENEEPAIKKAVRPFAQRAVN